MEQSIINPVEMGRGISEFGFMSVASACFLLTSISVMFLFIRWLMQIFNHVVETQTQSIKELLQSNKEQVERQKEQGNTLDEIRSNVEILVKAS